MSRIGASILARLASGFRASPEVLATRALWTILTAHQKPRQAFEQLLVSFGMAQDFTDFMALRQEYAVDAENRIDLVGQLADGRIAFALEAKWNSTELRPNQTKAYYASVAPFGLLLYVVPQRRLKTLSERIGQDLGCFPVATEKGHIVLRRPNDGKPAIVICAWEHLLDVMERASDGMAAEDVRQLQGMCGDAGQLDYQPFSVDWNDASLRRDVAQAVEIASEIFARAEERFSFQSVSQATDERTSIGWYFGGVSWAGWFGFEPMAWACHGHTPLWITIPLQHDADPGTRKAMHQWGVKKGLLSLTHFYTQENFVVPVPLVGGASRDEVIEKALVAFDELDTCYRDDGPVTHA